MITSGKTIATLASCLIITACTTAPRYVGDIALRNVNVVSMVSEEVLPNQTVIITNGKIVVIQPSDQRNRHSVETIIDGDGGYLIPGLADMHTHLGLILPWDGEPSLDGMKSDLGLYLPNGITTIRNMRATPEILDLRAKLDSGELIGPRLISSGPSLHSELPDSFGPKITSRAQAEAEITKQKSAGYDFIKVHQDLPQEAFDGVIETAAKMDLPVAGHVQTDKPAAQTARMSSIEHAEEVVRLIGDAADFGEAPEVLEAIKGSGAYVTPTLVIFASIHKYLTDADLQSLFDQPETAYVTPYWRDVMSAEKNYFRQSFGENYESLAEKFKSDLVQLQKLTAQLNDAGVPLLVGTDAVGLIAPGFSVHQELALFVDAGISPYDALKAATVNPARWAGREGEEGIIAIGATANLALLANNPLEDIRATSDVKGVMLEGDWIGRESLDDMLHRRLTEYE